MYILDRIISRSSRSLAAMIGFSSVVCDSACGGRSGTPDGDAAIARGPHVHSLPPFRLSSPSRTRSSAADRVPR
jgi:hypothetical protein